MFTGIIEEIGRVSRIVHGTQSIRLEIEAQKVLENTKIGDSIATNGVCLTATALSSHSFMADVMPETMRCTSLGTLKEGSLVNLERALALNSRLGGHLVSGHVDGTARLINRQQDDNAIWLTLAASTDILHYIIRKGSIAIDGVSLTVSEVDNATFKVSIIPHTQQQTTLTAKKIGDSINIENDLIARYVEKLMGKSNDGLTIEKLLENGF